MPSKYESASRFVESSRGLPPRLCNEARVPEAQICFPAHWLARQAASTLPRSAIVYRLSPAVGTNLRQLRGQLNEGPSIIWSIISRWQEVRIKNRFVSLRCGQSHYADVCEPAACLIEAVRPSLPQPAGRRRAGCHAAARRAGRGRKAGLRRNRRCQALVEKSSHQGNRV